jgi:hypothetical protein
MDCRLELIYLAPPLALCVPHEDTARTPVLMSKDRRTLSVHMSLAFAAVQVALGVAHRQAAAAQSQPAGMDPRPSCPQIRNALPLH